MWNINYGGGFRAEKPSLTNVGRCLRRKADCCAPKSRLLCPAEKVVVSSRKGSCIIRLFRICIFFNLEYVYSSSYSKKHILFIKYIVYSVHCVSVQYTTVYCINKVYTIYVFGNLYIKYIYVEIFTLESSVVITWRLYTHK